MANCHEMDEGLDDFITNNFSGHSSQRSGASRSAGAETAAAGWQIHEFTSALTGPPTRAIAWVGASTLFGTANNPAVNGGFEVSRTPIVALAPNASPEIAHSGGLGAGDTVTDDGRKMSTGEATACEYRGWLFVFEDKKPARVFHPVSWNANRFVSLAGTTDGRAAVGQNAPAALSSEFSIAAGVYLGLSYYSADSVDIPDMRGTGTSRQLTGFTTDIRTLYHGGSASESHTGSAIINFAMGDTYDSDNLWWRSYGIDVDGATTASTWITPTAGNPTPGPGGWGGKTVVQDHNLITWLKYQQNVKFKIINTAQYAMLRLPTVWKDRVVCAEGRDFIWSSPKDGGAQTVTVASLGSSKYTLTFSGAIDTSNLRAGDRIVICDKGIDPILEDGHASIEEYEIFDVQSTTVLRVVEVSGAAVGAKTGTWFKKRRQVNRSALYFLGDPGDPSVPTDPDARDWTYVDLDKTVDVGDTVDSWASTPLGSEAESAVVAASPQSVNGDIVRLWPQEDRLIIFFENSVMQVTGTPPVDADVFPTDYFQRFITRERGLNFYDAVVEWDDGQRVWFADSGGIYELVGLNARRVDDDIQYDSDYPPGGFTHLTYANNLVYASTTKTPDVSSTGNEAIFIFDTITGAWTKTFRITAASEPSGGSTPSSTELHPGTNAVFNPFLNTSPMSTGIVKLDLSKGCWVPADDRFNTFSTFLTPVYSIVAMNHPDLIHQNAGFYHGTKFVPPYINADVIGHKKVDGIIFNIHTNFDSSFDAINCSPHGFGQLDATQKTIEPIRTGSTSSAWKRYRWPGVGGEPGGAAVAFQIGDGVSPTGDLGDVFLAIIGKAGTK